MTSEAFLSFTDNIKQKVTNPFFGTLIIVWVIHNWEFIYRIFNYPPTTTLEYRLKDLGRLLNAKPFLFNLIECIFTTIIVLISSYILLSISRLIVRFYEDIIIPRINKLTNEYSIVSIEKYTQAIKERDAFFTKYNEEKELKISYKTNLDQLEIEVNDLTLKLNENNEYLKLKSIESDSNKTEIETLINSKRLLEIEISKLKSDNSILSEEASQLKKELEIKITKLDSALNESNPSLQFILTDEEMSNFESSMATLQIRFSNELITNTLKFINAESYLPAKYDDISRQLYKLKYTKITEAIRYENKPQKTKYELTNEGRKFNFFVQNKYKPKM